MPLASPDFEPHSANRALHSIQAELNNARAAAKRRRDAKMEKRMANPNSAARYAKFYAVDPEAKSKDPLTELRIESELKREIRDNINHQRMIGSYVGKRHAMHLPVRGQNTQSNAKTARRLNHRI